MRKKGLDPCVLVTFDIDRADDKVWKQRVVVDGVGTMTTNRHDRVFVMTADIDLPDSERKMFRFLHPGERLGLQGLPKQLTQFLSPKQVIHAVGNSYPPALVAAMFAPILSCLKNVEEESLATDAVFPACPTALRFAVDERRLLSTISMKKSTPKCTPRSMKVKAGRKKKRVDRRTVKPY